METKWIYKSDSVKNMKVYYLANYLYDKYQDEEVRRTDPDYIKGIEWEPYILYIFPTGFQDLYHCVIESGEGVDENYSRLNSKEIKTEYNIDIDEGITH